MPSPLHELTMAMIFGSIAFLLHIIAYGLYTTGIFSGKHRPNAASWLMWLFGAWVEYKTYNSINAHYSTSALPLACLFGVGIIFLSTVFAQMWAWISETGKEIYEKSDPYDYLIVLWDAGALVLFVYSGAAGWANFLAVATTAFTFIPMWKTTYRRLDNERPLPWFIWSCAYLCMFVAVVAEGPKETFFEVFYPVFYFILHLPVGLLCFEGVRRWVRLHFLPWYYRARAWASTIPGVKHVLCTFRRKVFNPEVGMPTILFH